MRTRTGYLFMGNKKLKYTGKALTIPEQIQLLSDRGLVITDEKFANKCLSYVGFYRLYAYAKPLLESHSTATFNHIWDLYIFDRKLRILVLDAVERIEVAFRVSISEIMSIHYDPFWYTQASNFANVRWHLEFMEKVIKLAGHKNHALIKHYYDSYFHPEFPPSWMMIECLTFGTWSKAFNNLKSRKDKKGIAEKMGQPFKKLESWIKCLTDTRNLCAHHERLWNHTFTYSPHNVPHNKNQFQTFYQQAYIIVEFLKVISPDSDWKNKLKDLFYEYENLPFQQMGFQNAWQNDPFWDL